MTDKPLTAEEAIEEIRKIVHDGPVWAILSHVQKGRDSTTRNEGEMARVQQGEVPADLEQRAREAHAQLNDLMMHFAERERLWPPVAAKTADVHAAIDTLAQAGRTRWGAPMCR